jgi:taurine--2-oxoglutarate transaminase
MNELVAACRREGLLPFVNFNRLHVVPPCIVTKDEVNEGLARLDRALSTIAGHYAG